MRSWETCRVWNVHWGTLDIYGTYQGVSHMMSALGGGGGTPKADEISDKLHNCDGDKGRGRGYKIPEILWTSYVHALLF